MVLSHYDGYSLSFLLELIQCLRESSEGLVVRSGSSLDSTWISASVSPKGEGVRGLPDRMFWSCAINLEFYW